MTDFYDFEQEKNKRSDEYETCVICNKETNVKKNTPIDQRSYYIKGIGQLCKRCFLNLKNDR